MSAPPPPGATAPSSPPKSTPASPRGPGWAGLFGGAFIVAITSAALLGAAKFGGWWWLGPMSLLTVFFFWYLGVRRNLQRLFEAALVAQLDEAAALEKDHQWHAALDLYHHAAQMAVRLRSPAGEAGEQTATDGGDRCQAAIRHALERLAFVMYGLHSGREKALANLQTEAVVNLTGINARDEDLEALPSLPHLNRLHVRGPFITDKTMRIAARARGLIEIYLENTAITDAGLAAFRSDAWLPNSVEINIARDQNDPVARASVTDLLQAAPPAAETAPEINDLKFLHLEGSPVTDQGLAQLSDFTALERLSIHKTRITGRGLTALQNLPLLSLSLEGRGIDDAGTPPISNLHRTLTRLELFDTAVTDNGLTALGELENLERLNLTGSAITDQGLSYLTNLKKLQFLTLRNTRVTATGIAQLQQSLPTCQITH